MTVSLTENFASLTHCLPRDLLLRLSYVTQAIAELYEEIAYSETTRRRAEVKAWEDSVFQTSVTARERYASSLTLEQTCDALSLRAHQSALFQEQRFIERLLDLRRHDA